MPGAVAIRGLSRLFRFVYICCDLYLLILICKRLYSFVRCCFLKLLQLCTVFSAAHSFFTIVQTITTMRQFIFGLIAIFCLFSNQAFSQFFDNVNGPASNTGGDIFRPGLVGIGFPTTYSSNLLAALGSSSTKFAVKGGIIAHYTSGAIGGFGSTDQWLGLGLAGVGTAYGLAVTKNTNTGVFNLLDEGTQTNLIAGFGGTASTNTNRFKIRGFSGTSLTSKDLFIVNPNGAIGVNVEPLASVWVDSKQTTSSSLFRDIAIIGSQTAGSGSITTASALGNQQNTSLVFNNIAVEGFRAQFPDFATAVTQFPQTGGAVNLQVVNNPLGTTDAIASSNSITGPSRPSRPMAGWASVPFSLHPALVHRATNKQSCWM